MYKTTERNDQNRICIIRCTFVTNIGFKTSLLVCDSGSETVRSNLHYGNRRFNSPDGVSTLSPNRG